MKRRFFQKLTTMKKSIITSILAVLVTFGTTGLAQDYPDEYLGLPGDNLNLYAVLKLFQESETLEGFERSLNDENSRINNLDLNGDNYVDYLTVNDYVDGDVHTIVLRAVLNKEEYQDVAVFTVQKFRDGSVQIQLVGDEALYGKNYIIEPYYEETPNPGYIGKNTTVNFTVVRTTPYQVATWPVIRFIYMPRYVVWRSSWYWGYYPQYWQPWRSYYWHYYYGYHYNWYHHYYRHYRHWHHYRYPRYNTFYYTRIRVYSPTVVIKINEGNYRATYSRPDRRRDGEALYTKLYPSQSRRTAEDNVLARQMSEERRSASRTESATKAETTRRSTGTSTDNARRPEQAKSNETTRRSTNATTTRTVTRPEQAKSSETTRRSTDAATTRTVTRPQQATKSETTRRSTQSVSNRTSSKSEPVKRAQSSRRSSSSETKASKSSSRSNSRTSKKATTSSGRSSSKKEKSDDNKSTRRR